MLWWIEYRLTSQEPKVRAANFACVGVLGCFLAVVAFPMPVEPPVSAPIESVQHIEMSRIVAKPKVSAEEKQARRLRECEAAVERKALACKARQTNDICGAWMKQVQHCHSLRK
jgi:hypothetical protein